MNIRYVFETCFCVGMFFAFGSRLEADKPGKQADPIADKSTARQSTTLDLARWERIQSRRAEIRSILRSRRVSVSVKDEPLSSVVKTISKLTSLPIEFDEEALADDGVETSQRMTLTVKDAPLWVVLDRLLNPIGLTWWINNDGLSITSALCDDGVFKMEYKVARLAKWIRQHQPKRRPDRQFLHDLDSPAIAPWEPAAMKGESIEDLLFRICRAVGGGEWQITDGGGGRAELNGATMIVWQSHPAHEELQHGLDILSSLLEGQLKYGYRRIDSGAADEARVAKALSQKLVADIGEMTINDFATTLAKQVNVNIWVDEEDLIRSDIDPTRETMSSKGGQSLSVQALLERELSHRGMAYQFVPAGVEIIASRSVSNHRATWVFDIRDLLARGTAVDWIADYLMYNTDGLWEEADGVGGSIEPALPGFLIVRQESKLLSECVIALADIRRMEVLNQEEGLKQVPLADNWETRLYRVATAEQATDFTRVLTKFVAPFTWQVNRPKRRTPTQNGSTSTPAGKPALRAPNTGSGFFQVPSPQSGESSSSPSRPVAKTPIAGSGSNESSADWDRLGANFGGLQLHPREYGMIDHVGSVLVIRQRIRVHGAIERFLAQHANATR